ncbi:MAG: hypothetical protein M0015_16675 [Betaproteobacteria bacterium]|nr:hypothetical protein [Betaproteobacteria bacterium]
MRRLNLPADTRAAGLALDRVHVELVADLLAEVKSKDARRLLELWRDRVEFEFVVLAGELYRGLGGVAGGLARTRQDALGLFKFSMTRLSRAAGRSGGFTSAWVLLLEPENADEFKALAAELQLAQGSA